MSDEMKKTASVGLYAAVPRDFRNRVKMTAALMDCSLADLVVRSLEAFLAASELSDNGIDSLPDSQTGACETGFGGSGR